MGKAFDLLIEVELTSIRLRFVTFSATADRLYGNASWIWNSLYVVIFNNWKRKSKIMARIFC